MSDISKKSTSEKNNSKIIFNIIEDNLEKDEENIITKGFDVNEENNNKKKYNYCFTLNNYTKEELFKIQKVIEENVFVYICWGYEIGKENKTPHLQGYFELKTQMTKTAIRKRWNCFSRCWLAARAPKSTKLFAVTYCAKELIWKTYEPIFLEEFLEENKNLEKANKPLKEYKIPSEVDIINWGRFNIKNWRKNIDIAYQNLFFEAGDWIHGLKPGSRNDINVIKDILKNGGNMIDVIESTNSYQGICIGEKILKYRRPTRNFKTRIIWLSGPSGSGKSHTAHTYFNCDPEHIWISNKDLNWFDGYVGQKYCIFEEMKPEQLQDYGWFLRLTDKYPMKVPVKGAFTDWIPKVIIITSVFKPIDLFPSVGVNTAEQGLRRIDEHIELLEKYNGPAPDVTDPDILEVMKNIENDLINNPNAKRVEVNKGNMGRADLLPSDYLTDGLKPIPRNIKDIREPVLKI